MEGWLQIAGAIQRREVNVSLLRHARQIYAGPCFLSLGLSALLAHGLGTLSSHPLVFGLQYVDLLFRYAVLQIRHELKSALPKLPLLDSIVFDEWARFRCVLGDVGGGHQPLIHSAENLIGPDSKPISAERDDLAKIIRDDASQSEHHAVCHHLVLERAHSRIVFGELQQPVYFLLWQIGRAHV